MKTPTRRHRLHPLGAAAPLTLLIAIVLCGPIAFAAEGPSLAFPQGTVEVGSLSPGGRVAVLGVLRWPLDYQHRIELVERLVEDADGDGAVRVELADGWPDKTVWVAVDLTDGSAAAATPAAPGSPAESVSTATLGAAEGSVTDARRFLAVLVARPGSGSDGGAWVGLATDGGRLDSDELGDGSISVSALDLSALTGGDASAGPDSFGVGDVIVGIDAETLEVWIERPAAALAGGAR